MEGREAGLLSPSFVDRQLLPIDSDCGLPVHGAKVEKHPGTSPLGGKCERASVPHVSVAVTCLKDACRHTHTQTDSGPQPDVTYCCAQCRNIGV